MCPGTPSRHLILALSTPPNHAQCILSTKPPNWDSVEALSETKVGTVHLTPPQPARTANQPFIIAATDHPIYHHAQPNEIAYMPRTRNIITPEQLEIFHDRCIVQEPEGRIVHRRDDPSNFHQFRAGDEAGHILTAKGRRDGTLQYPHLLIRMPDGTRWEFFAHDVLWLHRGNKPHAPGYSQDHINGIGTDNRACNHRSVPGYVQIANRDFSRNASSSHFGVSLYLDRRLNYTKNLYRVRITVTESTGKRYVKYFGLYPTDLIAAEKADDILFESYYPLHHEVWCNFPSRLRELHPEINPATIHDIRGTAGSFYNRSRLPIVTETAA